ncbi:Uncharacterised protein [Vibrio cholerae]|nr:Uncharacterised protein [Vibrio cholerae]
MEHLHPTHIWLHLGCLTKGCFGRKHPQSLPKHC